MTTPELDWFEATELARAAVEVYGRKGLPSDFLSARTNVLTRAEVLSMARAVLAGERLRNVAIRWGKHETNCCFLQPQEPDDPAICDCGFYAALAAGERHD